MAQNNVFSMTEHGRSEPFGLQVSRGLIKYHSSIFSTGYSNSVTSGQNYAVWPRAASYTFPTVASTMTLSSSATGDTTQSVLVEGLDANYAQISEVITLNGQTGVTSVNSYLRVNRMIVVTDSPTGSIYFGTGAIASGVPANVYGFIYAGDNATMDAIYTVPAGYSLFICGGSVSAYTQTSSKVMTVNFWGRNNGVTYKTATIVTSGGYQFLPYDPPLMVPEKTDIWDTATTTDNQVGSVSVNLTGYLVQTTANPVA